MQSKFLVFCQDVPVFCLSLALSHQLKLAAELSVVSSPSLLPPTWQDFLLFWERSSSRLLFMVDGKLAQLSQRKLLSVLCCHFLPSMLPFRMECCALGASLAKIFFHKYSASLKISFSITSVWFWFKLLSEYSEGWDHHTVACAAVEEKTHSVQFLLSALTGRIGNGLQIWELWGNSPS